jgi:long-chain acyl-CoA synthetase
VSGSAPIPPALLDWYRRLGLDIAEAYGMTENFGYSHWSVGTAKVPGHVGVARPGVQVRISPQGEILIKSPGMMAGYYKRPDLDAECFAEDGFLRTGDLGELRSDGQLRLTGRLKELFKTAKGKYVAPAPIESRLLAHPALEMAMVAGVGQPAPFALVVPAEGLRPRLGDPALRAQIETELGRLLDEVNEDLASHERLRLLVVAREPWTIESGQLTPTMKIKRSNIEAAMAAQVDAWYAQPARVLWA